MKKKYLRDKLEDIVEFLGSHFFFFLAITLGILITVIIILQYYDMATEPPLPPTEPHMSP